METPVPYREHSAYASYSKKGWVQAGLLWLTPEEKSKFRVIAATNGISMAVLLQTIVRDYLKKEEDNGLSR